MSDLHNRAFIPLRGETTLIWSFSRAFTIH